MNTIIGYAAHPADGATGTVYQTETGVRLLRVGGAFRSLPPDTEVMPLASPAAQEAALDECLTELEAAQTQTAWMAALAKLRRAVQ